MHIPVSTSRQRRTFDPSWSTQVLHHQRIGRRRRLVPRTGSAPRLQQAHPWAVAASPGSSTGRTRSCRPGKLGDHIGDLDPAVTHEVIDTHPHRRLQQALLPIDQPEPLLVIQITDRLGQRIDMTRLMSPRVNARSNNTNMSHASARNRATRLSRADNP